MPCLVVKKSALWPDSKIRKGLGKRVETDFKTSFSFRVCPEMIEITSFLFSDNDKQGVEGKG